MPTTQAPSPRSRSAFAAAFLSLLFPGLGQAYAGAVVRGLAFATPPFLSLALLAGIVLRSDRIELLGFVIQQPVLYAIFAINVVALIYRLIAVVDAWQVARYLNAVDASGGGRLGRARLPLNPLSIAGLLAVVLVLVGGHLAVARYNVLALTFVNCVFSDSGDASCEAPDSSSPPNASPEPGSSDDQSTAPQATDVVPTPLTSDAGGTPAPTLPPWNGTGRLNVLLVGVDQRAGDATFNTDTLIVASVDPVSKQVAMFQVPRDMENVPVPASARSFWGSTYTGKINSWFVENRNRSNLWPGGNATARGFNSLKALLGELYGIPIQYYVMVNFQGFRNVVDTLGGVQINVQIPVAESTYPAGDSLRRIYIPAGPQHMSGSEALIYARSRHRAAGGDFDRGRRQQRVLISLRDQMNARAILANLPALIGALQSSIKTDMKTGDLPQLLALAESVDTRDIRSYVFAPPYYAIEHNDPTNYSITPRLARIRTAVSQAFSVDPNVLATRDRLSAEGAQVQVVNASGKSGLASGAVDYLGYYGLEASTPNKAASTIAATTRIVVYNGADQSMPETIAYLENLYSVKATVATDPKVTADIVVTLGRNAPALSIDAPG